MIISAMKRKKKNPSSFFFVVIFFSIKAQLMEEIMCFILSFLSISMYSAENEDKSRRTSNVFSYQFLCRKKADVISFDCTSFTYCPNDNS
jgi:hypothetical protein